MIRRTAAVLSLCAAALALPAPAHAMPCLVLGAQSGGGAPKEVCVLNAPVR